MDAFGLLITGGSHFVLSKRLLSFNNVMITLTSARLSARIVELALGVIVCHHVVKTKFLSTLGLSSEGIQ